MIFRSKTQDGPRHPNIERVSNWADVEKSLYRMALRLHESGEITAEGLKSTSTYLP